MEIVFDRTVLPHSIPAFIPGKTFTHDVVVDLMGVFSVADATMNRDTNGL